MAMKEWVRHLQPVQLYVVLILTIMFFVVELIVSHLTHALTLLMDSYHMLCNIMVLLGCIATIKYNKTEDGECIDNPTIECKSPLPEKADNQESQCFDKKEEKCTDNAISECKNPIAEKKEKQKPQCSDKKAQCSDKTALKTTASAQQKENKLKNTFGWARIDVVIMLICCVFLASLCFSVLVEALQTLVHIDHHDEMHHPIPVLCLGAIGLLLNGFCYLLIGGYTSHEGSFLHVTKSGDVVLDRVITEDIKSNEDRLSHAFNASSTNGKQRGRAWQLVKDTAGCIFVIFCAILCYLTEEEIGKFIDPIFSIVSAVVLLGLSYPYIRESCLILLQTIPDTIDIYTLKAKLLQHFPGIVNVHDLHIWELTTNKIVATTHIIFLNQKVYKSITKQVTEFFLEQGITHVTIQPEFYTKSVSMESLISTKSCCLVRCQSEGCWTSHCCPSYNENYPLHGLHYRNKSSSKETFEGDRSASLKSVKIINEDFVEDLSNSRTNQSSGDEKSIQDSDKGASNEIKMEIRDTCMMNGGSVEGINLKSNPTECGEVKVNVEGENLENNGSLHSYNVNDNLNSSILKQSELRDSDVINSNVDSAKLITSESTECDHVNDETNSTNLEKVESIESNLSKTNSTEPV